MQVLSNGRKRTGGNGRKRTLPVAVALKFTVHVVQSFIKGHRKSGVISIKHSRDKLNDVRFLPQLYSQLVYTGSGLSFPDSIKRGRYPLPPMHPLK